MTTPEAAKSERVNVRCIWPLEADFTTWLAENIDLLSKVVGLQLQLVQEETWLTGWPEWTGRVDILAKIAEGSDYAVIENQMEPSDNDHLAGVLNYASHSDSRVLILVASEITPWHRRTMDWLNEGNGIRIYGVEMSAWRNGDVIERRLDLVAGPDCRIEWPGFQFPPDKQKYLDFFRPLVEELAKQGIADRRVPRASNDQAFPSGFAGIDYHVGFWSGPSLDVYLYIALNDGERNKQIFDSLYQQREEIKMELRGVGWGRRDNQRMSVIYLQNPGSIGDSDEKLVELRTWALDMLPKLKSTIQPRLEEIMSKLQSDATETAE